MSHSPMQESKTNQIPRNAIQSLVTSVHLPPPGALFRPLTVVRGFGSCMVVALLLLVLSCLFYKTLISLMENVVLEKLLKLYAIKN